MQNAHRTTWRQLTVALLALVAAFAASGCGGDDGSSAQGGQAAEEGSAGAIPAANELEGRTLVIGTWGGLTTEATKKYLSGPFSKETGVEVKFDVSPTGMNAPIRQQVSTGDVRWDIAEGTDSPKALEQAGLLEKYPQALIDRFMQTSKPEMVHDYIIDYQKTLGLIVCNPEVMERCPKTPADFWDVEKFPGPRSIVNWPEYAMTYALEAAGKQPDEIYPMDIDLAIEKLEEIKPHVRTWPDSGSQQAQLLVSGEVGAMAGVYLGSGAVTATEQMPSLEVSFEGAPLGSGGGWVVPKGAPNKDVAFAYLAWIADHPEAQAKWADMTRYPMPAKDLEELVKPKTREWLPGAHENVVTADSLWVAENLKQMQQAWQSFLGG